MRSASRSGWLLAVLAAVVLILDQASKYAVQNFTPVGSNACPDSRGIEFRSHQQSGCRVRTVWPIPKRPGARLAILFSVAVIGLIAWLLISDRAGGWLGQCGMALILGGAAGNVLDRIVRHSVTDFIDFYVGSHHWYTFNVADSAIVVGAALVLLDLLRDWRHPSEERA